MRTHLWTTLMVKWDPQLYLWVGSRALPIHVAQKWWAVEWVRNWTQCIRPCKCPNIPLSTTVQSIGLCMNATMQLRIPKNRDEDEELRNSMVTDIYQADERLVKCPHGSLFCVSDALVRHLSVDYKINLCNKPGALQVIKFRAIPSARLLRCSINGFFVLYVPSRLCYKTTTLAITESLFGTYKILSTLQMDAASDAACDDSKLLRGLRSRLRF